MIATPSSVRALVAAVVAAGLAGSTGCAGAPPAVSAEREVTLVLIKTGPKSGKLPEDETQALFAGHFANMQRLAEERELLLAGPYGQARHDPALRGIFVLDTADRARAIELAATDPTAQAGVFTLEYHALRTDAPLREVLESALAIEARAKAEGRERSPGEGARNYVLLTAEDGERARRLLEPLAAPRGGPVLLLGRLDGTRAFAILDASDPDVARAALGDVVGQLGPFVLDAWFATGELATVAKAAR